MSSGARSSASAPDSPTPKFLVTAPVTCLTGAVLDLRGLQHVVHSSLIRPPLNLRPAPLPQPNSRHSLRARARCFRLDERQAGFRASSERDSLLAEYRHALHDVATESVGNSN